MTEYSPRLRSIARNKNRDFRPIVRFISEKIQHRAMANSILYLRFRTVPFSMNDPYPDCKVTPWHGTSRGLSVTAELLVF